MTIREMHYDFKTKLNKVDSQQNRNLLVPEIDWVLNEAMAAYVRAIIQPKYREQIQDKVGFEFNQRTIDDIRGEGSNTLIKYVACTTPVIYNTTGYTAYICTLPSDYMFFLEKANVFAQSSVCPNVGQQLRCFQKQAHDLHLDSNFDNSSFEWRECNIEIQNQNIIIYTDGVFVPEILTILYFSKLPFIQNSQDFLQGGGTYTKPDGVTVLTGSLDCPLPSYVHYEIVDLAVAFTAGNIGMPDYRIKLNKMELTQ